MSERSSLSKAELKAITDTTVGHYSSNADSFWEGTRDHDVSQNREALLEELQGEAPFDILDFGCGPGRDLKSFKEAGHRPVGLDGSAAFCQMARDFSGCEVWEQNMLSLELPDERFDGIFANASLFHVPAQELSRVLQELRASLRRNGVLFASNPRGNNEEGWNHTRYGSYHRYEDWTELVQSCGFVEISHYYRPPGRPRAEQPWLATLFRRTSET